MNEIYDLDAIAGRAVDALIAAGAEKASCSVNYGETREFNYEGGDFSLFRTLFNTTMSLTSIKDGKKGSARINSFEDDAVAAAVRDCLATGEASEADDAWDIAPVIANGSFTEGEMEPDTERLFDRTRELVADIGRMFPQIVIEQLITQGYVSGRPSLGMELVELTSYRSAIFAGTGRLGVYVNSGGKTGLTNGDYLLSIDGLAIETMTDVKTALSGHSPGDTVTVQYLHSGAVREAAVVLVEDIPAA